MSSLVPTPRVDKNGRTVTRHMKQTEDKSASSSIVGAVPTLKNTDPLKMSDSDFLDYVYPDGPEMSKHIDAFCIVSKMHSEVRQSVLSFLELGNDHGTEAVKEYLWKTIDLVDYRNKHTVFNDSRADELSNETVSLHEALSVIWSVGSLREEVPSHFLLSIAGTSYDTVGVHQLIKVDGDTRDYENDRSYWRAVCAASMIDTYFSTSNHDEGELQTMRELIGWMEGHEHLGDIVRIGADRMFKDYRSIQAILEAESHSSLSSGAL